MENKVFNSSEDELTYYKAKASEFWEKFQDERAEFEDFQISSKELEAELEAHIKQIEKDLQESKILNEKYLNELQSLRSRVDTNGSRLNNQIVNLEEDLKKNIDENVKLKDYIRHLEQQNDDFERAQRVATASLEDFEGKLNCAIERNALLENELDEKEDLKVTIQRLKDEARDLQQELAARQKINRTTKNSISDCLSKSPSLENPPNAVTSSSDLLVTSTNNYRELPMRQCEHGLTPYVRISTLNIVSDLLSKVSHLENKLSSLAQGTAKGDTVNFSPCPTKEAFKSARPTSNHCSSYKSNKCDNGPIKSPV